MLLGGVQWTSGPATRPQESSPCSIVCKHTRCSQQRRCQSQCSSLVRTIARGTRRCVSASARASHQVVVRSDYEDQHDEVDSTDARVEEESLQVLEWPAVCKQVRVANSACAVNMWSSPCPCAWGSVVSHECACMWPHIRQYLHAVLLLPAGRMLLRHGHGSTAGRRGAVAHGQILWRQSSAAAADCRSTGGRSQVSCSCS